MRLVALIPLAALAWPVAAQDTDALSNLDHRTEAFAEGIVGSANTAEAAIAHIEADDWFTLPPINYIPPPYAAQALEGRRLCLDPGHGGEIDRAGYKRGASGFREAVMNLEVAQMVRDWLVEGGAEVVMTRDDDTVGPEGGSLEARGRMADRTGCDLFISIHHNYSSRDTANYLSIWYHARPDYPRAGVDLARWITTELGRLTRLEEPHHMGLYSDWLMYAPDERPDLYRLDTTEIPDSGFGVLRHARVPACLVEGSFYSHPVEEQRLMDREYLRREAWGIYMGIVHYLFAGVPSIALDEDQPATVRGPRPQISLTLDDGMHERWARNAPPRVHWDTLRVYIDDVRAQLVYRPELAEIDATPASDLAPGAHTLRLRVLNAWGNWAWPTEIPLTVE